MTRHPNSLDASYFDAVYAADPDPWGFTTSPYEAEKYAATLAALPKRSFASALEVGCSIGVLTRQLAPRCGLLLSIDGAESALEQARARCPDVSFERRMVPADWPAGRFDLILFSEVLYFMDGADIASTARLATQALEPGGVILMVHYLGGTDYPTSGEDAPEIFMAAALRAEGGVSLSPSLQSRTASYRLDRLQAEPDGGSQG